MKSQASKTQTPDSVELDRRPAAVIYTHSLLEGSNTFIKSHAEALVEYQAVYAGAHRIDGIPLPVERTQVLNEHTPLGVMREAVFRQFGWAPTLVRKLRGYRPRIVHAHFGTSGPAAMSLARALDVPLLVTFHGSDATIDRQSGPKSHRDRELLRKKGRLIDNTGAFIAVSGYIRKCLLDQGYPEAKIILHRNGIDLDFFNPIGDGERAPIIVFVGRFVEKKGAEYLIEAASRLHGMGVNFELVMIGSGSRENALKQLADNAKLPCRFTGFLPANEVRSWLQRASVVAIPSVTAANGDSEGLPTILLEAQALETPVVATRHSGIPEGVIAGVTAELIEERDTEALAGQLRSFLENPGKVSAFGKAGRQFVSEHFDLRKQVHGLEGIYADLAARHRAGQ
jgi:colanic acid/amylovoran biosynthesis glycosyltransferase